MISLWSFKRFLTTFVSAIMNLNWFFWNLVFTFWIWFFSSDISFCWVLMMWVDFMHTLFAFVKFFTARAIAVYHFVDFFVALKTNSFKSWINSDIESFTSLFINLMYVFERWKFFELTFSTSFSSVSLLSFRFFFRFSLQHCDWWCLLLLSHQRCFCSIIWSRFRWSIKNCVLDVTIFFHCLRLTL